MSMAFKVKESVDFYDIGYIVDIAKIRVSDTVGFLRFLVSMGIISQDYADSRETELGDILAELIAEIFAYRDEILEGGEGDYY